MKLPSWVYVLGVKTSPKKRYLATLLVITTVVLVWYFFVYEPMLSRQKVIIQELKQFQEKQLVQEASEKALTEHVDKIKNIKTVFETFAPDSGQDNISVLALAQQSGLLLDSYQPKSVEKNDWSENKMIACSFSGSFENMVSFLEYCMQSKEKIGLKDCSLIKSDDIVHCNCTLQMIKIKKEENNENLH